MKEKLFWLMAALGIVLFLTGVLYATGFILEKRVGGLLREDVRMGHRLMYDEQVGWIGKKHFQGPLPHGSFPKELVDRINGDGYRDDDWDKKLEDARTRGSKKILFLGDSFVYGIGSEQDQTLPAEAQKYADASGLNLKFFNAGIPAYGFMHYRRELERLLDRVHPDEAWLLVCANDWGDSALPYEHRIVARVYKPFYDEKGVLETEKVKRRPSLFFRQEFGIMPNHLTLAVDHVSYFWEDMGLFLKGLPTRWTSPLPISRYDSFLANAAVNAKFPQVRLKAQRMIEDMGGLMKERNVKFRVVAVAPWQEEMMRGFRAVPGLDLVILPEMFRSIFAREWGKNFLERHWNFVWACYLARHLVDHSFQTPGGIDPGIFRDLIVRELRSGIDFRDPGTYLRTAFGFNWKGNKIPLEPRPKKEGHFALSNPYGGRARVSIEYLGKGRLIRRELSLSEIRPFKAGKIVLNYIEPPGREALFFRVAGTGLMSVRVLAPESSEKGRVSGAVRAAVPGPGLQLQSSLP